MSKPTDELARLRECARDHGAWQTRDGVWVWGSLRAYSHNVLLDSAWMVSSCAEDVPTGKRVRYWSTPALAEAHPLRIRFVHGQIQEETA